MEKTHWKKLTNPNYIGSYSLTPGEDLTVIIEKVVKEMVKGTDGKDQECVVAYLKGQKPLILNKTNMKTIAKIYRTPYIEEWKGKSIILFAESVTAFGQTVDALRIRPIKPKAININIDKEQQELHLCQDIEQLKAIWLSFSPAKQELLFSLKEEIKFKLSN